MAKAGRLTEDEREQRGEALRQWYEERDHDPEFVKMRAQVQKIFESDDESLCGFAARLMLSEKVLQEKNEALVEQLNRDHRHSKILSINSKLNGAQKEYMAKSILDDFPDDSAALIYAQVMRFKEQARNRGKAAANALHSKPGGSREKRDAICAMWASGKYSSREICAEQECAGLGMSFSAARKALRNTPKPA